MAIYYLENTVQKYAWGSSDAFTRLLDIPNPDNSPMAELWMGAHPKAPSTAVAGCCRTGLDRLISESPELMLGTGVNRRFSGKLPFLFKVLAAGGPLSIQAHPTKAQAEEGFRRENEAGISPDAPERNYRDDNHKPEIICALTSFDAMRGFRPLEQIAEAFDGTGMPEFSRFVDDMKKASSETERRKALRYFFTVLMDVSDTVRGKIIEKALERHPEDSGLAGMWLHRLNRLYPGDAGVLGPLFLNVVRLKPGEAMYLDAGELHAYLEGTGIELMANSDNVLRGGLTPKHVDVPELLKTLSFRPDLPEILEPEAKGDFEQVYITPAPEFRLSRIMLAGRDYKPDTGTPSIYICMEGCIRVTGGSDILEVNRGGSFFISAFEKQPVLSGTGVLFRATVPDFPEA